MDTAAYADLVRSEQAGLLRLGWALTADAEQAHDLAQETLVRGFVKRHLVARADSPSAYLRTIMIKTVTTQCARALAHLRSHPDLAGLLED